jgi:hypothetical protein
VLAALVAAVAGIVHLRDAPDSIDHPSTETTIVAPGG